MLYGNIFHIFTKILENVLSLVSCYLLNTKRCASFSGNLLSKMYLIIYWLEHLFGNYDAYCRQKRQCRQFNALVTYTLSLKKKTGFKLDQLKF